MNGDDLGVSSAVTNHFHLLSLVSRGSRILKRGTNPGVAIIWQNFCRKIHENENQLDCQGDGRSLGLLDPPMLFLFQDIDKSGRKSKTFCQVFSVNYCFLSILR